MYKMQCALCCYFLTLQHIEKIPPCQVKNLSFLKCLFSILIFFFTIPQFDYEYLIDRFLIISNH